MLCRAHATADGFDSGFMIGCELYSLDTPNATPFGTSMSRLSANYRLAGVTAIPHQLLSSNTPSHEMSNM